MGDEDKKFTQADVDRIVSERLARDRESRGDPTVLLQTVAELRQQLVDEKANASALQSKVATTDRTAMLSKIGVDLKVPPQLMGFIQGDTDEAMRASATALIAGIGPGPSIGGSTNPPAGNAAPKVYTAQELREMKPEQINADWVNISTQLKAGQVK
ncbi:MAG: hypothetical protein WC319_02470 [Candidatus Paceibacterota bacterium]|jgi:hypothetical protein